MKSRILFGALSLPILALAAGCSAASPEPGPVGGGEDEVVGVTDLKELESLLGLQADKKVNGKWSRGDDKLTAGGCYAQKKGPGASEPESWEFRRYANGAAFFRKKDTGPASGDKRPVACVDIDLAEGPGAGQTIALDGFGLDAAVRYKLGKPTGFDGGAGQMYFAFSEGALKIRSSDSYCDLYFSPGSVARETHSIDPGTVAHRDTYWSCVDKGGSEQDCHAASYKACMAAVERDFESESLDRPAYIGGYVTEMTWRDLRPEQAMLAYKYAWAKAHDADLFAMSDDPIGRFEGAESYGDGPGLWHVARFERLDVHYITINTGEPGTTGEEELLITPKSSDKSIHGSAIVSCSRPLSAETNQPVAGYTCKGL